MEPEMAMTLTRALLACCTVFAFTAGHAVADDSGFAYSHDLRKEKGRTCMSDHYHQGGGSGSTRKAAEIDAIKSWQNFTDFEYGSDWARFSKATSKGMSCSQTSGGWECQLEARACK
jgi:hypothetical protein